MGESRVVIPIFGILDVTGEVIGMWVILAAVTVISLLATRHMRERPGKFQNVIETGVEYLDNYFAGILGKKESRKNLLFLGSLFIFIIFGNYTGLIPGAGLTDYWKAPTSSLSVTLGLSIITFFYLQGSSIHARGFLGYLKRFISPIAIMLPLLLLDEFIKPASLALRLFGNIFGGMIVVELWMYLMEWLSAFVSSVPFMRAVFVLPLNAFFDIFEPVIQTYIFVTLTMVFLSKGIMTGADENHA